MATYKTFRIFPLNDSSFDFGVISANGQTLAATFRSFQEAKNAIDFFS